MPKKNHDLPYMLPKEEIVFATEQRLCFVIGNSAGWTELSSNTNSTNIGTTALHAQTYVCQMSFVDI